MKKKIPNLVLSILFLFLIISLFIFTTQSGKTRQNDGTVLGNTAGNLYNGGLFCEYDGMIYFANHKDNNTLYRMKASDCSNIEKLYDDRVCYINADENYLYYSRMNHEKEDGTTSIFVFFNTGIYRINRNNARNITGLHRNPCGLTLLYGNHIYYQHYEEGEGLSLHRVGTDGENNLELSSDALLPACVSNDLFYYSGVNKDHYLHTMDTMASSDTILLEKSTYLPIVTEEGIYFMTLGDYAINRLNPDTGTIEKLVTEPCSTYNLSMDGRYLYYQVDRTNDNRICVLDLSTMTSTTILKGDYSQIHVTSNYMFFTDFSETTVYAYETNSSGILNLFQPPVETD